MFVFPIFSSLLTFNISNHCLCSWSPWSWADFSIFISVLESLNESEDLINISTDWQVTNTNMSQNTLGINNIGGSKCNTNLITSINNSSISLTQLLVYISKERNIKFAKTSLLSVFLCVLHVSESWIDWSSNDLAVDFSEILCSVRELNNFSWANKCEVKRIEEENEILAFVVTQSNVFEAIVPGWESEEGSGSSDSGRLAEASCDALAILTFAFTFALAHWFFTLGATCVAAISRFFHLLRYLIIIS